MASFPDALRHALPPLAAALLLGWTGWQVGPDYEGAPLKFQPQLVVRPSTGQLSATAGSAPRPDQAVPGRFLLSEAGYTLELRQPGWPSLRSEVKELRGVTALRLPFPPASLSVSVQGNQQARAELLELPKKTKLAAKQGKLSLPPGRHELLAQAEGYLPQRLTLDLKPGESRQLALELKALPRPPSFPSAVRSGPAPQLPAAPPAPSAGYAPSQVRPPVYQAPSYPPAPRPRFTPVAPPPQPPGQVPVPMFTPIGN